MNPETGVYLSTSLHEFLIEQAKGIRQLVMFVMLAHAKWHVRLDEVTRHECLQHLAGCTIIVKAYFGENFLPGIASVVSVIATIAS